MEAEARSQRVTADPATEPESVRPEDLLAALDGVIQALQQRESLTAEERAHLHTLLRLYESQRHRSPRQPSEQACASEEGEEETPDEAHAGARTPAPLAAGD